MAQKDTKLEELEKKYKEISDKQGLLSEERNILLKNSFITNSSKIINKNKNIKTLESKSIIELYKQGKISYEAALKKLEHTEKVNETCANIIGNIFTGFLATTIGLFAKGKFKISMPKVALIGAGIGAVANSLFNFLDRSLNNIENDEFDSKKILKDAASGSLNGLTSGLNAGFGKDFSASSILRKSGFELLKQAGLALWQKITHSDKEP